MNHKTTLWQCLKLFGFLLTGDCVPPHNMPSYVLIQGEPKETYNTQQQTSPQFQYLTQQVPLNCHKIGYQLASYWQCFLQLLELRHSHILQFSHHQFRNHSIVIPKRKLKKQIVIESQKRTFEDNNIHSCKYVGSKKVMSEIKIYQDFSFQSCNVHP